MTFEQALEFAPNVILRKLEQLKFLRENPKYHPEDSVYDHTQIVYERCQFENEDRSDNPVLRLAAIMHDICKFDVVKMNDLYQPTCPNHEKDAAQLMNTLWGTSEYQWWCSMLGVNDVYLHQQALSIVQYHMAIKAYGEFGKKKKIEYSALWRRTGIYGYLLVFAAADNMLVEFDHKNLQKSWKFNSTLIDDLPLILYRFPQKK